MERGLNASYRTWRAVLVFLLLVSATSFDVGTRVTSVGAHRLGARQNASATVSAAPATLTAGGVTIVSGSGFLPNEDVQILFDGVLKGTIQVLPTGAFSTLLLTIAANTAPGVHTLQVIGVSSRFIAVASITVTAAVPTFSARLTLSPPNITPGGEVVIDGSGFTAGETVLLRLNGNLITGIIAGSGGTFGGYVLTLPTGTAPGAYTITAVGATSNAQASATLNVRASPSSTSAGLSLSPSSGLKGARITASGVGFVPGELVLITINGAVAASATADAGGSFVNVGFTVPTMLGRGPVAVLAFGATSNRTSSAVLTVLGAPPPAPARLEITPGATSTNRKVTLVGSGFRAHEIVLIKVDGAFALSSTANAAGTFRLSYTTKLGLGSHTVIAQGAASERSARAVLVIGRPVQAGMHLVPNRSHRGAIVEVAGINFLPGETVLVRFRGVIVQSAAASSEGVVNTSFTVPGNTPYGVSDVALQGAVSGRRVQVQVGVLPEPAGGVSIHLSTATPRRGASVVVSGHGFQAGEVVLLRFRGSLVQAARADRSGKIADAVFVVGINVPPGRYSVKATGSNSGRTVTVKIQITGTVASKPTSAVGITISPTTIRGGSLVTVRGHGFQAGEFVLIKLRSTVVQAAKVDSRGMFRTSFHVASKPTRGRTTVQASGARSNRHAEAKVVIA
jgi:large repetitive protein